MAEWFKRKEIKNVIMKGKCYNNPQRVRGHLRGLRERFLEPSSFLDQIFRWRQNGYKTCPSSSSRWTVIQIRKKQKKWQDNDQKTIFSTNQRSCSRSDAQITKYPFFIGFRLRKQPLSPTSVWAGRDESLHFNVTAAPPSEKQEMTDTTCPGEEQCGAGSQL